MTNINFNKYDEIEQKIEEKLRKFLVPDSGESDSAQGELIRKFDHVMHEIYGNGGSNWVDYKYKANLKGYSKEYFIDLAKTYLDKHSEILNEIDTVDFVQNIQECEDVVCVEDLSAEYIFNDDGSLFPDFSKCITTKEQLNSVAYWDEYLDWMYGWLSDHPLSEWDLGYINKLHASFEIFRPYVPIGVISYESEEEWHRQNKGKESSKTGRDEINAQEFIQISVLNWIYCNPDLVDINGNDLNKSVENIFKE